ncbi:O-antigen ligase family protein [Sphingomonas sp. Y38-1Y]|uniref:O-antigen ligase family protein n=1 Tax=Sphingomonas sp. Y38-1Y TaxID=3078265 RepID=UPI0028ED142D|nr:O-antigen ligase family protein [Sphingomonas sp. Y38-1Y]
MASRAYRRPYRASAATYDTRLRRRRWIVANLAFAGLLFMILIGTAPLQDWVMAGRSGQGDIVNQVLIIGLFLFLFFGNGSRIYLRQLMPLPLGIVILLAYCALSLTWAVAPWISLRRWVQTVIIFWMTFRCVRDLGYDRTVKIVRYGLILLLVGNYLAVFGTDFGIHTALPGDESTVVGNWRGLMPHKNIAGAACGFTILFLVFDRRDVPRWIAWPTIAASLVFLNFAESRTSEMILIVALGAGWLSRLYSADYRTVIGFFALLCTLFALQVASLYSGTLREVFNDPSALTGRGSIWPLLIEYAQAHPLTGAGYSGFWQVGDNGPIWTLTDNWVARYAGHGHNGYLDLLVTLGIPGLVLGVVFLVIWPLTRLLLSLSVAPPQRALLIATIAFAAGHNLTESSLLTGPAVVQHFLTIAIALVYVLSEGSEGLHHRLRVRALRSLRLRSPAASRPRMRR